MNILHQRHPSLLLIFGIVMFALAIGGCGGVQKIAISKDEQAAGAKMTLAEAKEAVLLWLMRNPHPPGNDGIQYSEIIQFGLKQPTVRWYKPGDKVNDAVQSCPYQNFDPYIDPQGIYVDTGCNVRGVFDISSTAPNMDQAKLLLSALWRWKISTLQEREALFADKEFDAVATQYRTEKPRPVITEDIRRFQVMAMSSVLEKKFGDAVIYYSRALKIAPWWPQGHFNVAILLGQLHFYDEAIDHMKKYLMLVPDAPNARAAQDQIYKWEADGQPASQTAGS